MYRYGENDRRLANDWRPEIHDFDGLAIWTGSRRVDLAAAQQSAAAAHQLVLDGVLKGFGLLQRDRDFAHYQDDGVFERRPSVWVEPPASGARARSQLVEIPTQREAYDNVAAYWVPKARGAGRRRAGPSPTRLYFPERRAPGPPLNVGARALHADRPRRRHSRERPPQARHVKRKFVIDFGWWSSSPTMPCGATISSRRSPHREGLGRQRVRHQGGRHQPMACAVRA